MKCRVYSTYGMANGITKFEKHIDVKGLNLAICEAIELLRDVSSAQPRDLVHSDMTKDHQIAVVCSISDCLPLCSPGHFGGIVIVKMEGNNVHT